MLSTAAVTIGQVEKTECFQRQHTDLGSDPLSAMYSLTWGKLPEMFWASRFSTVE